MEGLSKEEEGLLATDTSVVSAGGEGAIRGLNGNGKNTINFFKKQLKKLT